MNQFCGYLAANIRVVLNLNHQRERADAADRDAAAWTDLQARAAAIGCKLQRCVFDEECDGDHGECSPGLRDRDDSPVGDLASDEPGQDLGMFTLLVEQLEANGGIRP